MGSDFVRSTVYILIKVQIILLCLFILFYTWCFVWIYIQSNALCSKVTQMVTEKNYLTSEDIATIKEDIQLIYSRSKFDSGTLSDPVMGVSQVTITCHQRTSSSITTMRTYTLTPSTSPAIVYRVQSGNMITVSTTFKYPRVSFLVFNLLSSGSDITVNDLARNERVTSGSGTIKKYTIGMKYYPDLGTYEYKAMS